MFSFLKRKIRSQWYPISQLPEGYFKNPLSSSAVQTSDEALQLSSIWASMRWFQTTLSSLPLITYVEVDKGREQAKNNIAYNLLNYKPNPAMTRNTLMQVVASDLFLRGESFCQLRWRGNGQLFSINPIQHNNLLEVIVDEEWNKAYAVRTEQGIDILNDVDVLHIIAVPNESGIRGESFLKYAGENLGLHKQVQDSATAYYRNASKPSGYLKYAGRLSNEAINTIKEHFKQQYQGTDNRGSLPILTEGGEFIPFAGSNAEDAQICQALNASVGDVGRWTGISSMLLGDYAAAKYASLSAENQAVYQKSLRWMLEAIEAELNSKIFGISSPYFCEFDTKNLVRGDELTQAQINQIYLSSGVLTVDEVREQLHLQPLEKEPIQEPIEPQPTLAEPQPQATEVSNVPTI